VVRAPRGAGPERARAVQGRPPPRVVPRHSRIVRPRPVSGREIPARTILEQVEHIPQSIEAVAAVVDRCYGVCNDTNLRLSGGITWEEFADVFRSRRDSEEVVQRKKQWPSPASCSSHKRRSYRQISVLRSSEENHKSDDMNFYGKYAHLRKALDYTVRQPLPVVTFTTYVPHDRMHSHPSSRA
jgi:hypothetical protein